MPPRRLRSLIVGVVLTFIGPALGFVLYFAFLLSAAKLPLSLPEALADLQQLPGRLMLALLPLGLGLLCGAVGLAMIIANLAIHFLGQASAPSGNLNATIKRPPPSRPSETTPTPPAPALQDDSRYMPKVH